MCCGRLIPLTHDRAQPRQGTFALPITATLLLQASPLAMGAIAAAGNLSYAVLGLPAGVWIDRWNKRTVLIVADAVLAFSLASIAIAYALDVLTVVQLIVVSGALGVAGMFFNIAHMSILPFILAKRAVADGNARLQTTNHAIGSVAPSLAGALAQAIAAPFLYGICAVLHVFSAAFLRRIDA
ncbi:MAG TPA: MFS transporter [Micromonospora sp.]|nr:MFS transporter [Micromonospora sp.]